MSRIQQFQNTAPNANKTSITSKHTNIQTDENDAFKDSLNFFNELSTAKSEKTRLKRSNNVTLKNKMPVDPNRYLNIATELPPELELNAFCPPAPAATLVPVPAMPVPAMPAAMPAATIVPVPTTVPVPVPAATPVHTNNWNPAQTPSYGNLKKGALPTYRNWKGTTQKNKHLPSENKPKINISTDAPLPVNGIAPASGIAHDLSFDDIITSTSGIKDDNIITNTFDSKFPVPSSSFTTEIVAPVVPPRRKKVTRTSKYKLGKHANGKVSILIKNSQTRRRVQTEHALLKNKGILDIKNYLRSKNLLKAGADAPIDVLRQLYEQSILAGQVENKSKDTLIHNFFNDK